jgi:hypothetical protein
MRFPLTLLFAAGVVAVAVPAPLQAKSCLGTVRAQGPQAVTLTYARKNARGRWQQIVAAKHGEGFKSWANSIGQHYLCHIVQQSGGAVQLPAQHQCIASAKPCGTLFINPNAPDVLN